VLLPALMVLLGRWNWWAPPPLAGWHARLTGAQFDGQHAARVTT